MRALHRDDGKKINRVSTLCDFHSSGKTGKTAANNRYLRSVTSH
jgi:hypothetical protein